MPKKASARSSNYHHGDLRNALVEAGRSVLERDGVAKLSLREVARVIGVSHGAPLHHFPSKEALLIAIAAIGFRELTQVMRDAVAKHPDEPLDQFRVAGVAYVRYMFDHPHLVRLMLGGLIPSSFTDPELKTASREAMGVLYETITAAQASGKIVGGDAQRLAFAAWANVHGTGVLLLEGHYVAERRENIDIEAVARRAVEFFYDGIRRRYE
jgi:AcrR family transcriptional regulator